MRQADSAYSGCGICIMPCMQMQISKSQRQAVLVLILQRQPCQLGICACSGAAEFEAVHA